MAANHFISVDQAREKILKSVKPGKIVVVKIADALGSVLARDIKAPINSPLFDQSAMDGYAISYQDFARKRELEIVGEAAAGMNYNSRVKRGHAVRIFTGARVPAGANTVVMQEKTRVEKNALVITDMLLQKGANIRFAGEQVKKGKIALKKGLSLNSAALSFLSSLGILTVPVYSKPRIAVIITGSELVKAGKKLKPGQIYESNATGLISALSKEGISGVKVFYADDTFRQVQKAYAQAASSHDFVLFTGGISVGAYDFVGTVMKNERVKTIFYKVRQKPGKPLFFGMKGSTVIFGLPGNPASVMTCFYEYVVPAIRSYQSSPSPFMPVINLPISNPVRKKKGISVFLKAITDFNEVQSIDGQESHIMKSFAEANCLVELDEDAESVKKGDLVKVHLFNA